MKPIPAAVLLQAARSGGYAIGAFNAVNLETAQAIVQAAEAERAPVILQISENAARYGGLSILAAIGQVLKSEASVPVMLHYDHAESLESAERAIELGFDSVMLEGADLEYEANLRRVQELVAIAHAHGVAVEAELEVVKKGARAGKRAMDTQDLHLFTRESSCDSIAIDIGTRHKQTGKTTTLDFRRLTEVAQLVPHPLVLHGSSGVKAQDLKKAVRSGISKVNIATELMMAFSDALRKELHDQDRYDPRHYLGVARAAMRANTRRTIQTLGSAKGLLDYPTVENGATLNQL